MWKVYITLMLLSCLSVGWAWEHPIRIYVPHNQVMDNCCGPSNIITKGWSNRTGEEFYTFDPKFAWKQWWNPPLPA